MKRFVQFRLRTMLFLCLLSAVMSAFAGRVIWEEHREQVAINALSSGPNDVVVRTDSYFQGAPSGFVR